MLKSMPPPPSAISLWTLDVVDMTDDYMISTFGPVIITAIKREITINGIMLGIKTSNELINKHGRVASLIVCGPKMQMPNAEIRKKAEEATKAAQKEFICTSNLVLANGVLASFLLMALLALSNLLPSKKKHQKNVQEVGPAADWLVLHLEESSSFRAQLLLAAQRSISFVSRP